MKQKRGWGGGSRMTSLLRGGRIILRITFMLYAGMWDKGTGCCAHRLGRAKAWLLTMLSVMMPEAECC